MFDTLLAKVFTLFAQVMVKFQPVWDKYKLFIVFLVGVLIGWFALGWGLFPIEWTDATPGHLRADYRAAYLAFSAEEFYRTRDKSLLQTRLGLDLPKSKHIPWLADEAMLQEDLKMAVNEAEQFHLQDYVTALNGLQQASSLDPTLLSPSGVEQAAIAIEGETPTVTPLARALRIAVIAALVLIVSGGAGLGIYLLTRRQGSAPVTRTQPAETGGPEATMVGAYDVGTETRPVKSFATPYIFGDDYFDPSFSIEIDNDFLGECGIGISEILGAGDPKKVTAFEAWLFDKSDIRTVTKYLATEHAYNDPDLRAKLDAKGEVLLLTPGNEIVLETNGLRVKVRISDLEYGEAPTMPPNSFVQKVNFELEAWVKQPGDAPVT